MDKFIARLIKRKRKKAQIIPVRNFKRAINIDSVATKKIIRGCCE